MDTGNATVTDIDPATGDTTGKENAPGTAGTESVASETAEQAGGSQEHAEGSQADDQSGRRRGPTKLDTIRELRSKLRERDQTYSSEMQTLKSQIEELKGMVSTGPNGRKPSKTFWEAPEDTIKEMLEAQRKGLLEEFQQSREQDQQSVEWKLETSKAVEFIKSQKGMTLEDTEDIMEIVNTLRDQKPSLYKAMGPMDRAEYALNKWKVERGITDNSALKSRASSITGGPGHIGGKREWTKSEINAEINKFPIDPKNWTPEQHTAYSALESEWKSAFSEGRVK